MSRYSLKRGGQRPQAWIGAVIGLASTAASLYSNWKNRQAQFDINNANLLAYNNQIKRQDELDAANSQSKIINDYYANEDLRKRNLGQDLIYACGGKVKASSGLITNLPGNTRIIRGGNAIPLNSNTFLLQGRSHNQGGIDINYGNRKIEAEGGEITDINPSQRQARIFSRNPMIPMYSNGGRLSLVSPANLVLAGYPKNEVFAVQQQINGNNGSPVKRNKAEWGDWVNLGSDIGTALGIGLGNYIGYKRLNTKLARPTYYEETPVVLDTRYHNAAQLANLDRMRLAGNRSIGQNTASSQVAQHRMRLNNLDYLGRQNELLDYAANQEAALRNTQAQIEQGVRQRNIAAKNAWSQEVADITNRERELENNRTLMLTQNHANTLAGINRGLSNFTGSILQRQQDKDKLNTYIALGGEGTAERMALAGVNLPFEQRYALYNKYINKPESDRTPDENQLIDVLLSSFSDREKRKMNG